ncbi:MAG: EAL domain-containing protein [Treponema sp.]|nr:EAL domain-containing protein [Treponema sp.]
MRAVYIAWNSISTIALIILAVLSTKRKARLSPLVTALCALAGLCLMSYTAQFFTCNKRLALTLCALYYIFDLCVLFAIYVFVISIAEISKSFKRPSLAAWIFFTFAGLNFMSFIVNIWTEHAITLTPVFFKNGSFNYWARDFQWPIYFNLALQVVMSVVIIWALLKRTFKLPSFYRSNFITISSFFLLVIILNSIYYFGAFKLELSILLYLFLAIYAFQISFWGIKSSLLNTMISLASENISYAVVCFASRGMCFYLNREARNIFGYGPNGLAAAEGFRDKLNIQYPEKMFNFLTLTKTMLVNNETRTFDCEYKILKDKKNRNVVSYLKLVDTTEELARLEEERFRSEHDMLTGLYNRSTFFKKVSELLRASKNTDYMLVATDIMDFKIVNNLFGNKVGDEVLKMQAALLSANNYQNAIYGRMTGDKFAALVPKNIFDLNTIAQNNMALQQIVSKYNYRLQCYAGIYAVSDKFENPRHMYDKAAMTIETIRGNLERTTAFYDSSIMDKQIHDKRVVSEFDEAMANGEFAMYLQPQVNSADQKVLGAEALARWISPERGVVPPGEFIPVLEKSGMIHKLDQFMWETAIKKLAQWKEAGNDMHISVNISAKDFYYCDVYSFLTGLVEKYGVKPQKLNIEITETVLMQDINAHRQVLKQLNDYGFTIEMDDFGSGFSSLNTLKDVEMDALKIDMGFLLAENFSQKAKDIISAIISMSKTLGMTVITEGVETEDQTAFLTDAGCDIFQGFYFSKPIPVEDYEKRYCQGGQK